MATLTDADVAEFWRLVKEWQAKLSLGDWRIVFSPIRAKAAMAEMTNWNWTQRQVTCRVGLDWKSTPITAENLSATAAHEVLHVLLYELIALSKEHQTTSTEDLTSAEHRVVNTLEKLLAPGGE